MNPILGELFEKQRVKTSAEESTQGIEEKDKDASRQGESVSEMEEAKREQKKREKESIKLAAKAYECLGQIWPKPDSTKPSAPVLVEAQQQQLEWVVAMLANGLIGTDWETRVSAFTCLRQ